MCRTSKQQVVSDELFKWMLFPFSLTGRANIWYSFVAGEVSGDWAELVQKFCMKIFPILRIRNLRMEIIMFKQSPTKTLIYAWERYKNLLMMGPDLGIANM